MVDRGLLVAEIVIYFTDAIEDPAEQLIVVCSSREGKGIRGIRERLLPVSELDVDERDRIHRPRFLDRIPGGAPMESSRLKVADSLQHRFTRSFSIRGRGQAN